MIKGLNYRTAIQRHPKPAQSLSPSQKASKTRQRNKVNRVLRGAF